jgi:xylan 1,4-beta-xylosidase
MMNKKISRRKFITAASLSTGVAVFPGRNYLFGMVNRTQISVDARKISGPLSHIWNGYLGNLCLTLNPLGVDLMERINATSNFPFYRRCWGITSSGTCNVESYGSLNVYHEDANGNPLYDFVLFDQVFDILVSRNIIPIMCIGFMPDLLSSASSADKDGNYPPSDYETYAPNDYDKWYNLVYVMVGHCVDRYGRKEVTKWKWELWNEPDISNYWRSPEEEFFKLYDYTAAAVKDAFPEAEVGGNAVSHKTSFMINFIRHCLEGTNYRDSSKGAPLDFITFHLKGSDNDIQKTGNFTSEKLIGDIPDFSPSLQLIIDNMKSKLDAIASIPGTEGLPVYITECDIDIGLNTSIYENPILGYRNTEYHAAFQCALAKEMLDIRREYSSNPVERLIIDSFFNPGRRMFEGQRTLFTADGIEKPVFNAFRLLGKMGTRRIQFDCSETGAVDGLASLEDDNSIQIMVYNYNEDVRDREMKEIDVSVWFPEQGLYRLQHYRIDQEFSNSYSVWKSLGKPTVPDGSQMDLIKSRQGLELLEPERTIDVKDNGTVLSFNLPHHSVSLLVFQPVE